MNKITNIQPLQADIPVRQTTQSANGGDLFRRTLDDALAEGEAPQTNQPQAAAALGEIRTEAFNPIEPAERVTESSPDTVTERTDSLIGLMDEYFENLSDPTKSLRGIAPLINTIKTSARELMQEARQTLNPDEELQQIARQCAVMANVEYINFERGDYL